MECVTSRTSPKIDHHTNENTAIEISVCAEYDIDQAVRFDKKNVITRRYFDQKSTADYIVAQEFLFPLLDAKECAKRHISLQE